MQHTHSVQTVTIEQNILAANDTFAQNVRAMLTQHGIRTLNLMSSPGAGKTTLLEQTVLHLHGRLRLGVIEGDIQTSEDAERIAAVGAQAVQINTQGNCHLEAHMIQRALPALDLDTLDLLVIENVGNLVCPADWQLGEDIKVVVTSTTEGDEKPAKYPHIFAVSDVLIINKLDLLPYVDYDIERVRRQARAVNPHIRIFEVSCRTGEGLDAWCDWLVEFASTTQ